MQYIVQHCGVFGPPDIIAFQLSSAPSLSQWSIMIGVIVHKHMDSLTSSSCHPCSRKSSLLISTFRHSNKCINDSHIRCQPEIFFCQEQIAKLHPPTPTYHYKGGQLKIFSPFRHNLLLHLSRKFVHLKQPASLCCSAVSAPIIPHGLHTYLWLSKSTVPLGHLSHPQWFPSRDKGPLTSVISRVHTPSLKSCFSSTMISLSSLYQTMCVSFLMLAT